MHIMGWECSSHLRVMFSERTAQRVRVTHTCELLELAPGSSKHSSEEKIFVGRVHFVILSYKSCCATGMSVWSWRAQYRSLFGYIK